MMIRRGLGMVGMIVIVAAVLVLGAAGWYLWSSQSRQAENAEIGQTKSEEEKAPVEFKTIKVNGRSLKYPLDDNNRQVIVEDIGNPYSPQIAFEPLRRYFMGSTDQDCRQISEGLLQVDTLDKLMSPIDQRADRTENEKRINAFISAGLAAKLDDDLYVLSPRKQNEPCEEAAKPKDAKLQIALFESQEIERTWLASLELAE